MVERVCSEVLILREGRVAAHAATAVLREQVNAASLEDAFRTLTVSKPSGDGQGKGNPFAMMMGDVGAPIGDAELRSALVREYRKIDAHCPLKPALAAVG